MYINFISFTLVNQTNSFGYAGSCEEDSQELFNIINKQKNKTMKEI
jgi:hypothetical protein